MSEHIYFMGIGGTGMAAVAGLCQEQGHLVSGSDGPLYPPMSTMLEELKIKVRSPYTAKNLDEAKPDLVVVANALSRGNEELEHAIELKLPLTSFAALMGEKFLADQLSVVVTGTHGKTTTTSLMAHCLDRLGIEPGFLIGGIPQNFGRGFRLGAGKAFVIEGDEYDTAYFDKGPKFLHYRPDILLINNIEFDHADIYEDLKAIQNQFAKVAKLAKDPLDIIANVDSPAVDEMLVAAGLRDGVTSVATTGKVPGTLWSLDNAHPEPQHASGPVPWQLEIHHREHGDFKITSPLSGAHNAANVLQVIAAGERMRIRGELGTLSWAEYLLRFQTALLAFKSVKRRLELLTDCGDIQVYDDFAHHPTAIAEVIAGLRKQAPERRVIAAFEPKNATGRRNILLDQFAASLREADLAWIAPAPIDHRIPEKERMDTKKLQQAVGNNAAAFTSHDELLQHAKNSLQAGDSLVFMSPGSFAGIHFQLADYLQTHFA